MRKKWESASLAFGITVKAAANCRRVSRISLMPSYLGAEIILSTLFLAIFPRLKIRMDRRAPIEKLPAIAADPLLFASPQLRYRSRLRIRPESISRRLHTRDVQTENSEASRFG